MKKFFLASLLIALTFFFAFSCKNRGENTANTENAAAAEETFVLPEVEDVCTVMDDPSFKSFCIINFDADSDGKLSMAEAAGVLELVFPSTYASEEGPSGWEYDQPLFSLKGLEYFPNIEALVFEDHEVTSLDVSKNPKLVHLYCSSNKIGSLDVSHSPLLRDLHCFSCGLTSLDVSLFLLHISHSNLGFLLTSKEVSWLPSQFKDDSSGRLLKSRLVS